MCDSKSVFDEALKKHSDSVEVLLATKAKSRVHNDALNEWLDHAKDKLEIDTELQDKIETHIIKTGDPYVKFYLGFCGGYIKNFIDKTVWENEFISIVKKNPFALINVQ